MVPHMIGSEGLWMEALIHGAGGGVTLVGPHCGLVTMELLSTAPLAVGPSSLHPLPRQTPINKY